MRFNSFIAIGILFLGTSCASLRPIGQCSKPDYNGRIHVSGMGYQKRPNAIGLTVGFGLPAAGAVAGYYSGLVMKQTDEGRVADPLGGAVFGALVGTGLTYVSNLIAEYGETRGTSDAASWARKLKGDYILLSEGNNYAVFIVPSAETNFTVKNVSDLRDFAKAFPNSLYTDSVFDQGLSVVKRNELPWMIETFPMCRSVGKAKQRYVQESTNFKELNEALARYPVVSNTSDLYQARIHDAKDALEYYRMFPNAKKDKSVILKAFESGQNKLDDVEKLYRLFGTDGFCLTSRETGKSASVRSNYADAAYGLANRLTKNNAGYSKLMASAADNGNVEAMYTEGVSLWNAGRRNEAKNYLAKASEKGHTKAMAFYATILPDGAEKTSYIKRSAEAGEASSMVAMAKAEMRSLQLSTALEWYKKALAKDSGVFKDNWQEIILCELETGRYSDADADYEKVIKSLSPTKDASLIKTLYQVAGVDFLEKNAYSYAAKWLEKSASAGDENSSKTLGMLYYECKAGKVNYDSFNQKYSGEGAKIRSLLKNSAQKGDMLAQYMLAETCANANDYKEAVYWYEKVFYQMDPKRVYTFNPTADSSIRKRQSKADIAHLLYLIYRVRLDDIRKSDEWHRQFEKNI